MRHPGPIAFLALSVSAAPLCAQQNISAADFQKAAVNRRVSIACADGTNGAGRYTMPARTGRLAGTYTRASGEAAADTGSVRAEGANLCLRFKTLNDGAETCFGVSKTGARDYRLSSLGLTACSVKIL